MEVLHISCNMGKRDLPDMYALSPRACGPWASGHTYQANPSCPCYNRDLPDMYALSPRACGPWASGHTYQANPFCPCYNLYMYS